MSNGTDLHETCRRKHITGPNPVTDIRFAWGNWVPGTDNPDTITITASIEYPAGTFTQVRFGGASSIDVASGAQVMSDMVRELSIPANTTFWERTCVSVASGKKFYRAFGTHSSGSGVSTGSDLTMSGTIADSITSCFGADAVIGTPTILSSTILCIGDSIGVGSGDTFGGFGDNLLAGGIFGRAVVNVLPNFLWSQTGYRAQSFNIQIWPKLSYLAQCCTHCVINLGSNDIGGLNGSTDYSTLWTNLNNLGIKVYQCTCPPRTTSTDGWVTTGNQTKNVSDADRVLFNNAMRAITSPHAAGSPLTGFIEVADTVESARDSGLWKANYTADGIHGNATSYPLMAAAVTTLLNTLAVN